jgi:16S rRNA processing protein RimM
VGAPKALEGFVRIKPLSGETGHFFRLKEVTLKKGEREETKTVAETILHGDDLLMRFEGINDPESAKALKGAELITRREYAAPLNDGEYYVDDLKGLEVLAPDGSTVGRIVNLLEGGGGDLAEISLLSGDTKLVPFRKEFFGDVDLEKGKIALIESWILE